MAFVASRPEPTLPAPVAAAGVLGWLRQNLFSSPINTLVTIIVLYAIYRIVDPLISWAFINAVWTGTSADACPDGHGACWAFVRARFRQIVYGDYPLDQLWRINVLYAIFAGGLVALMYPRTPGRKWVGLFMLTGFPVVAFLLLVGGVFGLRFVGTNNWGGLMLTLVVAVTAIVGSIPLGLILALGRRSEMKAIRSVSTAFIELWRGVPLIAVLFMASALFPLFTPEGVNFDKLVRTLLAFAIFSSAFMAEVFRGGLQAIPRGQYEAAKSLGIGYWKMMGYVILPQAIRHVIPALVNTCIGIFKETTLVLVIGLTDLLGVIQLGLSDTDWIGGGHIYASGYLFAGLAFWAFTFGMSRYSIHLERHSVSGKNQALQTL